MSIRTISNTGESNNEVDSDYHLHQCTTECPQCGETIGALQGSFDAICKNCGFKIPCCGD